MAIECKACLTPNRVDARFCEECGSPLTTVCPACSAVVGQDKRFCGDCGSSLTGPADEHGHPRDELDDPLRQATIVALQPSLAEAADGQERAWLGEQVEGLGGRLVSVAGGAYLAVFGIPVALEDQHRRAMLFAFRTRDAPERGAAVAPAGVGVVTGPLPPDEAKWSGDIEPIRTALVIARLASSGEILVDSTTARLLRGSVRLDTVGVEDGPLERKYLPLQVVVGELDTRRVVRHRDGRPLSHFVGRSREIALLKGALKEATAGGGQIVGIVGEAGMGKSRLLEEFRRSVGAFARWVEGHCLPYGGTRSYLPILDIVRDLTGVARSDDAHNVRAHVVRATRSMGLGEDLTLYILDLLNALGDDASEIDALSPEATRDRTFEAVRQLVLAAARREPMVIAIEDVHWSDDTSLSLLSSLATATAGVPVLLITSFRPGSRPAWLDLSYATQIALSRLGPVDSLRIVQSVCEREDIPEVLGRAILARADGNPFFLEELALARTDPGEMQEGSVPETVQGVILARIDRLPEAARRVLQTAAVLGREFSLRLLEVVWSGPGSPRPHLELLTREEFLVEVTIDGQAGFEFKHALTQDVAYQSLPTGRRRSLHEAAGVCLEDLYAGRVDEAYDLLAHHWSRTDDAPRAIGYLRHAAEASSRRYAHREASAALREGLRHAQALSGTERDTRLAELTLRLVNSLYFLGDMTESANELDAIAPRVEHLLDRRLVGAFQFWVAHTSSHLGDHARAASAATAAVAGGQAVDDDAGVGRALYILCREGWWTGAFQEGITQGKAAVPLLAEAGEFWWLGHCHFFIAHSFYSLGDFDAALEAAGRGGAIGEAVADPRLRSWAAWARGLYEAARGNTDVGLEACATGVELSRDGPNTAWALGALGFARREAGDIDGAIQDLLKAIDIAERTHHPGILSRFEGWLAETYVRAGDLDRAEATADSAFSRASQRNCPWVAALARRTHGKILDLRGDREAARRALTDAKARLETLGCRFDLALAHMDIARLAKKDGRDPEPSISAARALLDELKAPIYSERLRALAAELGCAEHDTTLAGHLTAREKEVLILIAEGLSNKEIAERLVISQGTAIRHVANIFAKIGVNNRTAAARAALDLGLV